MRRGLAPILVLLVIAAIGGVYYFGKSQSAKPQSPNPVITSPFDKTVNWKTYGNSQGKYTLKYPSDWGLRDIGVNLFPKEDQAALISYTAFSKVYKDNPDLRTDTLETPHGDPILTVKKNERKTLQQITDDYKNSIIKTGNIKRSELRTIDKTEAVLIVTGTEYADPKPSYFNYYFIKNQQIYTYSYYSPDESPSSIPDQILSTFKFTQ